jgi:phosphohistidine swiveling domain-containing protein
MNIAGATDFDEALPPSMRKRLAELDVNVYTSDAAAICVKLDIPERVNMIKQTNLIRAREVLPADKCTPPT